MIRFDSIRFDSIRFDFDPIRFDSIDLIDLEELSWVRQKQFEDGARLWHTAVPINQSTVIIVGGLTNNIQAPEYVTKHHAEKVKLIHSHFKYIK